MLQLCLQCFGEIPDNDPAWIKVRNSLTTYDAVYCLPAFEAYIRIWFCQACPVNQRYPLFVSFSSLLILLFSLFRVL